MKAFSLVRSPYTSLALNTVYAFGNCIIGFLTHSWWFITVGAYYIVLAITRFSVLQVKRKAKGRYDTELFARRITGILLVVLSFCIVGMNIMSAVKDRGTAFHEIAMITIATYTFTKITIAIIGMVKAMRSASPVLKTLRNISLADACVSIYTMQRSMLVSFPGMEAAEILLLNIFTGTAVWIVVLLLGINLIGGKYTDMAKSKIVNTNEKIAKAVASGYKKIEKSVVGGYKKIEQGVVGGYTKLEDKFIDAYLTKDGETVAEAKARLKEKK
jgi:succinate dehydrogenase hydrophobic anchor subunit